MLLPSCRHSPSRNWGETVNCWRAITKRGLTGYVQGKATRTRPSWLTSVRSTTTQRLSEPQPKSSSWVMLLACTGGAAQRHRNRDRLNVGRPDKTAHAELDCNSQLRPTRGRPPRSPLQPKACAGAEAAEGRHSPASGASQTGGSAEVIRHLQRPCGHGLPSRNRSSGPYLVNPTSNAAPQLSDHGTS